jgi:hypothetical protein
MSGTARTATLMSPVRWQPVDAQNGCPSAQNKHIASLLLQCCSFLTKFGQRSSLKELGPFESNTDVLVNKFPFQTKQANVLCVSRSKGKLTNY